MSERVANKRWYRGVFGYVGLKDVPWVGLLWVLVAAIIYSLIVLQFFPINFAVWMSTFVATLLPVLAGVFIYRHQVNRKSLESLYRYYTILDAEMEAMLWRIDPDRSGRGPLEIKLPSGSVASAHASIGEKDEPMFEEIARAGQVRSRRETLLYFVLADTSRAYNRACSHYISLFGQASLASNVGSNTEQALLHAANHVERLRKGLIKECENMRQSLAKWLDEYKEDNPWGPENVERSPEVSELFRKDNSQRVSLESNNQMDKGTNS